MSYPNEYPEDVVSLFGDGPDVYLEIDPQKFYPIKPHQIVRHTGAAIAINAEVHNSVEPMNWRLNKLCWFPKSELITNYLPGWLFLAKAKEAQDALLVYPEYIEGVENETVLLKDFSLIIGDVVIGLDQNFESQL